MHARSLLAALAALLASGPASPLPGTNGGTQQERVFQLVTVNERPLPFHDTTDAFVAGDRTTATIVRATLRVRDRDASLTLTRHDHFLDPAPCAMLRQLKGRAKGAGSGGMVAMTPEVADSARRGCDQLREDSDTTKLHVLHAARGVEVLVSRTKPDFTKWPFPAIGSVVGDTARLTEWSVAGDRTASGYERALELRLVFTRAKPRE